MSCIGTIGGIFSNALLIARNFFSNVFAFFVSKKIVFLLNSLKTNGKISLQLISTLLLSVGSVSVELADVVSGISDRLSIRINPVFIFKFSIFIFS